MPVITFYDKVEHDEQLNVHLDCCRRTFNTHPVYLTNLTALRGWHSPDADRASSRTRGVVMDIVSQLMVSGQQHQRSKKLDLHQPVKGDHKDCALM